jgi:hypothetical protein
MCPRGWFIPGRSVNFSLKSLKRPLLEEKDLG